MALSSSLRHAVVAFSLAAIFAASGAAAQVVAFGASNVSGANMSSDQTFPELLQAMLHAKGIDASVTNAGVSGDTTDQMLARVDSDVPAGTKVVLLDMSGGMFNDNRLHESLQKGRADMAAIQADLRRRGVVVIPLSASRVPAAYKQQDGVHLTAGGQQRMANYLLPLVVRALQRKR